ncbi:hypothetical protein RN001_015284 [Aquatica leii]|uniref:Zinc finger MYM-type protein 1-like n=1 Tax=Aquatica leii TaxID=1421715 RepID=A0AAN7SNG6_9COLE|nr:hypothetical protein RN001_015284 [Aquatica leii]
MSGEKIASWYNDRQNRQNVIVKEEQKWKQLLVRILDIIRFLAKQNLAFRGHKEIVDDCATGNKGNFLALVHLLAKYDPRVLPITRNKNEFINCLGNHVRKKILAEVKEAKYFTIVFDSTPDLSHKDQTSQILRYVKLDDTKVQVIESFIDFSETEGKKAEDISKIILDKIESDGLDIQNCRGQAYDNAAVMSGIHSGVQTRIKAINLNAQYVACSNHTLNLVGVHAASVAVNSVTFFGTMDKVFNNFSSSTHRWKVLTDIIVIIKSYYTEIIEVLESLLQNIKKNAVTRSDAGLLLLFLQSLPFLAFLRLWNRVLCEINDTQFYLQTKGLNVHHCAMKINALQLFLVNNRDVMVNDALSYAKTTCEDLGIDIALRKECTNQWIEYQLHVLDVKYSFLTPTNLLNPEYKCEFKEEPSDVDMKEFEIERERLRNFIAVADTKDKDNVMKGSFKLLEFIQQCNYGISVPNIVIMLRIFLTMAINIAACEQSFSKLKLIKNYLRSIMSSTRLSNLAILSIEQSITEEINFDDVINNFAVIKARKVKL